MGQRPAARLKVTHRQVASAPVDRRLKGGKKLILSHQRQALDKALAQQISRQRKTARLVIPSVGNQQRALGAVEKLPALGDRRRAVRQH